MQQSYSTTTTLNWSSLLNKPPSLLLDPNESWQPLCENLHIIWWQHGSNEWYSIWRQSKTIFPSISTWIWPESSYPTEYDIHYLHATPNGWWIDFNECQPWPPLLTCQYQPHTTQSFHPLFFLHPTTHDLLNVPRKQITVSTTLTCRAKQTVL